MSLAKLDRSLFPAEPHAGFWARPLPVFVGVLLALLYCVGFFVAAAQYQVDAHPGVDQNGYLVGGKMFSQTFSAGYRSTDPFGFVGRMWISASDGWFYPKYPIGLPVLYAAVLWLAPHDAVYWVSPVCMTLAIFASFLFLREIVSPFGAMLGMMIISLSPVTLGLTNNPNSHASTFACVAWGMYLLVRWWRAGSVWRAIPSGLLLGYAVTIRYTEGLLLLPVALVIVDRIFRSEAPRAKPDEPNPRYLIIRQGVLLIAAWLIPVGALVSFNLYSFGAITGYDPTNESSGFNWKWFANNVDSMVRQLSTTGLFWTLPFAAAGAVWTFARDWRVGLLLVSWALPGMVLYTSYYWAPDDGLGYMRFFLTLFPPLVAMAAVWVDLIPRGSTGGRVAGISSAAGVVMVGGWMSIVQASPVVENEYRQGLSMELAGHALHDVLPNDAVVFGEDRLLHHLQFVGDYALFSGEMFTRPAIERLRQGVDDPDAPQGLQPQRAAAMYELLKGLSDSDLVKRQNQLMTDALAGGRRVFIVAPKQQIEQFRKRFINKRFEVIEVTKIAEAPPVGDGQLQPARGGRPNARRGQGDARGREARGAWQVLEIKQKQPAPATRPGHR